MTKEIAIEKLAALCSRSEQCEYDLTQKMFKWGLSSQDRKGVLDYLIENKFLDNSRFAKSYCHDKARFSYWGPYKIKIELLKRRVNSNDIKEALESIDPQIWKEGVLHCAEGKSKNLDLTGEEGYESRLKLFKYLISRGFPSIMAKKAVALMKKRQECEE